MASPAEIIPAPPETLPADFSGWDSEDPAAALPVHSSGFKAVPGSSKTGSSASPEPPAQRASASPTIGPAVEWPNNPPSLTPAAAFAEAEDFLKTFRPKYFDPEELASRPRYKLPITKKTVLAACGIVSIVLLIILISLVYPRLAGRNAMAKQSSVRQPAPVAQIMPASTAAIQKPLASQRLASQPTVSAQDTPNAPAPDAEDADAEAAPQVQSEAMSRRLTAPARIPQDIRSAPAKDTPPSAGFGAAGMESLNSSGNAALGAVFNGQARPKVKAETPKIVNVSAGVAVGLLIQKTAPAYPPIAKTARVSGTVVLQAVISKTGTIDDVHVISGPEMLRQAAVNAVRTWRYRPYMLNNEPIAVETTVNVIFALNG